MAEIHAQLIADCHYLGRFPLCHLLLMNDRNYPWLKEHSVPQLHLHHIACYQSDVAWPWPVWGKVPAVAYSEQELDDFRVLLAQANLPELKLAAD